MSIQEFLDYILDFEFDDKVIAATIIIKSKQLGQVVFEYPDFEAVSSKKKRPGGETRSRNERKK